jgi:iron complex transport system substrate-binding protein
MRKILYLILFLLLFYNLSFPEEKFPKRIISLGPVITEQLYLLGVQDNLVGCTKYCERPPEAKKKEKVGTVVDVDIEKIISLSPDLVLATSLTDPKDVEKLKNLGIKIVTFSYPKNFEEICQQFLKLGKIVGKENRAKEIIKEVKNEVGCIREKVKKLSKPKVIVQIGSNPLWVAIGDSFINDFIEFANGVNIAKGAKTGLYSREKIISQNPDIIIIAEMGLAGKSEKKIWEKYKTINAVKNKRIYIFDAYKLCSPTPLTFSKTLKEISKIFHPELK